MNPLRLQTPLKVTISLTHTCNLDCRLCYADCNRADLRPELEAPEWIRFIDELVEQDIIAVLFEGGEPFHKPGFLNILHRCADKMLTRIRTNGTLITCELAQELKAIGVGTVLVDFLGSTPRTHDRLTGASGSHEKACKAVRALLAAGVPTQMLMILNRQNIHELQGFVVLAHELGVRTVGVLRPYPIGRARRNWKEFALGIEEMTAALSALTLPDRMKLMQSWHPNDGNCCWQMAAVNAYGDSIGCTYLREFVNYGNIQAQPFVETWHHPLYRALREGPVESSCPDCSHSQGSHGGCRSTAFAFHGRWTAPDPFDLALNNGVDLRELPEWMLQAEPRPPDQTGAGNATLHRLHTPQAALTHAQQERLVDPGIV